jgi:hypothetical protein
VTGSKALCCTPEPAPTPAAAPCPSGYVWRESFEGDALCVKPDERYRLENGTCRSGYVWRDLFAGDKICVTPADRDAAHAAAEANAKKPVKKLGKKKITPSTPAAQIATAAQDGPFDVLDSPVEPREKIGEMEALTQAPVLAHHPDGWCKLKGVADNGGDGWVAQDHLTGCP